MTLRTSCTFKYIITTFKNIFIILLLADEKHYAPDAVYYVA